MMMKQLRAQIYFVSYDFVKMWHFSSKGEYKIRHLDNKGRFETTEEEKEAIKKAEKKRRPKNGEDF